MLIKKSVVFGLVAGVAALAAVPSVARATVVDGGIIDVTKPNVTYPACVAENDISESPVHWKLATSVGGNVNLPSGTTLPQNWMPQTGYVMMTEEPAGLAGVTQQGNPTAPVVPATCTAANIVKQLTALVNTGVESNDPAFGLTGSPMIDIGCSDVVVLGDDAAGNGHIILLNDYSSTTDVQTAINTYLNGIIPAAVRMGRVEESWQANPDSTRMYYTFGFHAQATPGGTMYNVVMQIVDLPDNLVTVQSGGYNCPNLQLTDTLSDVATVSVPAAPPFAVFGLAALLAACGIFIAGRTLRTQN